jgi:DNA helicase-2/ATP-dependent DNA helicase PcrA
LDERSTTPFLSRGGGRVGERAGWRAARAGRVRPAEPAVTFPEEESQDAPRFALGERVRHRKFGGGVIRTVAGAGRDFKVTVEFDDQAIGTKQLLAAYAGLEREWESE